jgi:hypothetical protein
MSGAFSDGFNNGFDRYRCKIRRASFLVSGLATNHRPASRVVQKRTHDGQKAASSFWRPYIVGLGRPLDTREGLPAPDGGEDSRTTFTGSFDNPTIVVREHGT